MSKLFKKNLFLATFPPVMLGVFAFGGLPMLSNSSFVQNDPAGISQAANVTPEIGEVEVSSGLRTARVSWHSNEPVSAQVTYNNTILKSENIWSSHSMILTGLEPGNTYQAVITVTDRAGNVKVSDPIVVVTKPE